VLHLEYAKYLGSLVFGALETSDRQWKATREARN
jgi:hypothetical protein